VHKPWQIALVFGLCLAVVLAVLGWASVQVLRLDRAEADARLRADQEEAIRLALWRMDSALATLIAQESARPYFEYSAFYPAERAYTRMFNPVGQGDILLPSPILVQTSPYILINFQFGPDGGLSSPQVPAGAMRTLAESGYARAEVLDRAAANLERLRGVLGPGALAAALPGPADRPAAPAALARLEAPQPQQPQAARQEVAQAKRSAQEFQARAQWAESFNWDNLAQIAANRDPSLGEVREGVMRAVWLGEALVLARRVSVGKGEYVQGAWLDWPALRRWLLESVRDLLPEADLAPAPQGPAPPAGRSAAAGEGPPPRGRDAGRLASVYESDRYGRSEDRGRMLAALPARLVPGDAPERPAAGPSALVLSLIVAWICVLVAGAAVAALLAGTVALSERRAAFVSAVTHELRTPLTTFRLYSEMLASGMVADQGRRARYLETLRVEAERLVHLVENVLAYARLERGRAPGRAETVPLADLVERVRGRLADRARQAGFELIVETCGAVPPAHAPASGGSAEPACSAATRRESRSTPGGAVAACVRADPAAVEQVLFNLVDNACKYAAGAEDRRIHLAADARGGRAAISVCDHGAGISAAEARRLFRPFSKSAAQAANSAPGVGLGLALSRRLAREMGGDLVLEAAPGMGACFVLYLPMAAGGG